VPQLVRACLKTSYRKQIARQHFFADLVLLSLIAMQNLVVVSHIGVRM